MPKRESFAVSADGIASGFRPDISRKIPDCWSSKMKRLICILKTALRSVEEIGARIAK